MHYRCCRNCNEPAHRSSDVSSSVFDEQVTLVLCGPLQRNQTQLDYIAHARLCIRLTPIRSQILFSRTRTVTASDDNMASIDASEQLWNCLNCKRRKVRCDRQYPCANCVKGERDCAFPTSGRVFKRAEPRIHSQGTKTKHAKLMDRIRRLEKVVDDLNTELESRSASFGGSKRGSPPNHDVNFGDNSPDGFAAPSSNPEAPVQESVTLSDIIPPGIQSQGLEARPSVAPSQERSSVYVGDHFWASLRREASS